MARDFVQPNPDGSYTAVHQDDSGNYSVIPGGENTDRNSAERALNKSAGFANEPEVRALSAPAAGGGGNLAGGYGQYNDYMDQMDRAKQAQYLQDRLNKLDIPMSVAERERMIAQLTGYYLPGSTGTPMSDEAALDAIWSKRPDLADFYRANGWSVDTPEQRRAATRNWIDSANPAYKGKTPQEVAQDLGIAGAGGKGMAGGYQGQQGALSTFDRQKWEEANKQWREQFGRSGEQWNQQFGEGKRQFDVGAGQWDQQFGENRRQFDVGADQWNRRFGREGEQWNQQFGEGKRQFDVGLGENRRQFDVGLGENRRQFDVGLLASKSGPRDWAVQQALRPAGAFGTVQASPSWEGALVDYWRGGQNSGGQGNMVQVGNILRGGVAPVQQGTAAPGFLFEGASAGGGSPRTQPSANLFGSVRQPTSIKPQQWNQVGSAGQEMQRGLWSAQGLDPEDTERVMRAAWPTGTASRTTYWR